MKRFFLAVVFLSASLAGQQAVESVDSSREVSLWVTVTDKKSALVGGLPQTVFEVYEDGERQTITSLEPGKTPVSIGILLDNSASMGRKLAERNRGGRILHGSSDVTNHVHRVLSNFLAYFPEPENEFFLIVFGSGPEVTTGFTTDRDAILKAVGLPSPAGKTALLDTLHLALRTMEAASNSRKVFLLISDGVDTLSRSDESEFRERLTKSQVSIYSVGVFGLVEPRNLPPTPAFEGNSWLSRIARLSGGRHFPVVTPDGLLTAADQIGRGLAEQYCLRYVPPASGVKNRRKLEVKVNLGAYRKQVLDLGAKLPLRVHTRTSYDYTPSGSGDRSP